MNDFTLLGEVSALFVFSSLFAIPCFDAASLEFALISGVRLEFDIFVFFELYGWRWVIDAANVVRV
jgi:hypothetical protein